MFKLRDYQEECISKTVDYCRNNPGQNPICVLPTGAGKSIIIAKLCEKVLRMKPETKILVLAHRKELLQQNAAKLADHIEWGIYSAGLNRRDTEESVIFAGIQSIDCNLNEFNNVGLVIVDEAHLIPFGSDTRYRRVLDHFSVRTIGFTATPYRLDGGLLHVGTNAIFDQIVFDIPVRKMIDDGYLCKLVSKVSKLTPDLSGVNVRLGEYVQKQLDALMMDPHLIQESIISLVAYSATRKKVLIFACGIAHANLLSEMIPDSKVVTSETQNRNDILDAFSRGEFKYLINVDVLTTGFDEPGIDTLVMLRPTKSTALYVQMIGRSLRVHPDKTNALILDYAGNIREHGAIDTVKVHFDEDRGKATKEVEEFRVCPVCESVNEMANRHCFECEHQLIEERQINHDHAPEDIDINSVYVEPQWLDVDMVQYTRHPGKKGKKDTLKCEFFLMMSSYSEWLCVEHSGFAYDMCMKKLEQRRRCLSVPWRKQDDGRYALFLYERVAFGESLIDLLVEHHKEVFHPVTKILVDENGKYPEIKDYAFN